MSEPEDPWRERGRAALVGLILAFGVVALVLLDRRRDPPRAEGPAYAGLYEVVAECVGCGCEPADAQGLAVIHPGLPPGRPSPATCADPVSCAEVLARRAPPGVRAPVVLEPSAEPALLARELGHGPPLEPSGEGFAASASRRRQGPGSCVSVRRSRSLEPLPEGGWRWVERYASATGETCGAEESLPCVMAVIRQVRPFRE